MSTSQSDGNSGKNFSGFTIIEVLVVLAVAALILVIVFLGVPALQRNSRNYSRRHDVAMLKLELINYANANGGGVPGPYTGGVCFEYTTIPAPGFCAQSITDYFSGLIPELSFYKKIDQFFYATDYAAPFAGWCTRNPATCTGGARNISSVVPDTGDVFINSSSICVGSSQIDWTADFRKEIIAYAVENGSNSVAYQCVNVFDN